MRNLPTTKLISAEIKSYFTESMKRELKDLIAREPKLRVSGFPFCGLQTAYKKIAGIKETKHDAGMPFYTSVGTAAHLVFQRYLGQKGQVWGDWKCYNKECNHIVRFSLKTRCPQCKSEMEYEEFEVKAFKHLSGHIDGVYQADDGTYWIIDYKTSSVKTIRLHRKQGDVFPYSKNKAQIMTYCALIEKKYGIKISGWSLLYVARDDPFMVEVCSDFVTDKAKRSIIKKCKLYDDQWSAILELTKPGSLDFLVDTKPCRTYDFYLEHFKGFKGCPLEAVCFTKRLPSFVHEALEDYKADLLQTRKKRVK